MIKVFTTQEPEYRQALALRYEVLRKPLGLEFTTTELQKDVPDIHLGLFENNTMIACLSLTFESTKAKMRQVAVLPDFQGKGFGKQLAIFAEVYATEKHIQCIYCNARKTAVPFYKSIGYEIVGKEFEEVGIPHYKMQKRLGP